MEQGINNIYAHVGKEFEWINICKNYFYLPLRERSRNFGTKFLLRGEDCNTPAFSNQRRVEVGFCASACIYLKIRIFFSQNKTLEWSEFIHLNELGFSSFQVNVINLDMTSRHFYWLREFRSNWNIQMILNWRTYLDE